MRDPVQTVAELIAELQTAPGGMEVFLFDGAEAFRVEVCRVERRSSPDRIYLLKTHTPEDSEALMVRQLMTAENEVVELANEIENARAKLKRTMEYRDTLKGVMAAADKRKGSA